jgi:predicted nucleic acid-binding protein
LLDGSAYTAFTRGHQEVDRALRRAKQIYLTPVILGELEAGFRWGTQRQKNEAVLAEFRLSKRVEVLGVDEDTATFYADITLALRRAGRPIPTNDIWIAASAMQHYVQQVQVARFEPAL